MLLGGVIYLCVGAMIGEWVRWGSGRLGWLACLLIILTWPVMVLAAAWRMWR